MLIKSRENHRGSLRVVALGVVIMFTVTSFTWPARTEAATVDIPVATSLSLAKLVIPSEMGSIQNMFLGTRSSGLEKKDLNQSPATNPGSRHDQQVVLIQDAHAVIDAQENIGKILGHLGKNYGVKLTALEGAKGRLEPVLLRTFPDPDVSRRVLAGYEQRAELSGVEMASVFQDQAGEFRGMEDWKLYEKNYVAYIQAQGLKDSLMKRWAAFKQTLDDERASVYGPRLNEFEEARENYLSERASLLDLLIYLSQFSDLLKKNPRYQELPNLIASISYEKSGKQEALAPLVRKIADEFKMKYLRGLGVKSEMNFYNRYQAFMTGQITAGQMLQYLVKLGGETGKKVKLSPALKRLLGHTETLSEIRGSRLYDELEQFLAEVESSLIKTPAERELAGKYSKLFLLKDMISLELTHEAYAVYQKDPKSFLDLIPEPTFRKDLAPASAFYQAAIERDHAFFKNIMSLTEKESSRTPNSGPRTVAVVAGGFHTNGLERILQEKGWSYAVVAPKIDSLTGIENYAKVMKGDLSFKDGLKTTYFDALMRDAGRRLIDALPVQDRVRTLKAWRDNLIRELAREDRLGEAGKFLPYIDEILQGMPDAVTAISSKQKKEDILNIVRKELETFKKDSLDRILKNFEHQLGFFVDGLKELISQKNLNNQSVSALLDRASQAKPSHLGTPQALDDTIEFVSLPLAALGVPEVAKTIPPSDVITVAASIPVAQPSPSEKRSEIRKAKQAVSVSATAEGAAKPKRTWLKLAVALLVVTISLSSIFNFISGRAHHFKLTQQPFFSIMKGVQTDRDSLPVLSPHYLSSVSSMLRELIRDDRLDEGDHYLFEVEKRGVGPGRVRGEDFFKQIPGMIDAFHELDAIMSRLDDFSVSYRIMMFEYDAMGMLLSMIEDERENSLPDSVVKAITDEVLHMNNRFFQSNDKWLIKYFPSLKGIDIPSSFLAPNQLISMWKEILAKWNLGLYQKEIDRLSSFENKEPGEGVNAWRIPLQSFLEWAGTPRSFEKRLEGLAKARREVSHEISLQEVSMVRALKEIPLRMVDQIKESAGRYHIQPELLILNMVLAYDRDYSLDRGMRLLERRGVLPQGWGTKAAKFLPPWQLGPEWISFLGGVAGAKSAMGPTRYRSTWAERYNGLRDSGYQTDRLPHGYVAWLLLDPADGYKNIFRANSAMWEGAIDQVVTYLDQPLPVREKWIEDAKREGGALPFFNNPNLMKHILDREAVGSDLWILTLFHPQGRYLVKGFWMREGSTLQILNIILRSGVLDGKPLNVAIHNAADAEAVRKMLNDPDPFWRDVAERSLQAYEAVPASRSEVRQKTMVGRLATVFGVVLFALSLAGLAGCAVGLQPMAAEPNLPLLAPSEQSTASPKKSEVLFEQQREQILSEIEARAVYSPKDFILEKFRSGTQVVVLGDTHPSKEHKQLVVDLLESGQVTDVALELNEEDMQDFFSRNPRNSPNFRTKFQNFIESKFDGHVDGFEMVNVVETAWKKGVRVVWMDPRKWEHSRGLAYMDDDKGMADHITRLAQELSKVPKKILVLVGNLHAKSGMRTNSWHEKNAGGQQVPHSEVIKSLGLRLREVLGKERTLLVWQGSAGYDRRRQPFDLILESSPFWRKTFLFPIDGEDASADIPLLEASKFNPLPTVLKDVDAYIHYPPSQKVMASRSEVRAGSKMAAMVLAGTLLVSGLALTLGASLSPAVAAGKQFIQVASLEKHAKQFVKSANRGKVITGARVREVALGLEGKEDAQARVSRDLQGIIDEIYGPVLSDSERAAMHDLAMFIIAIETKFQAVIQKGEKNRPVMIGMGLGQVELATIKDILLNYFSYELRPDSPRYKVFMREQSVVKKYLNIDPKKDLFSEIEKFSRQLGKEKFNLFLADRAIQNEKFLYSMLLVKMNQMLIDFRNGTRNAGGRKSFVAFTMDFAGFEMFYSHFRGIRIHVTPKQILRRAAQETEPYRKAVPAIASVARPKEVAKKVDPDTRLPTSLEPPMVEALRSVVPAPASVAPVPGSKTVPAVAPAPAPAAPVSAPKAVPAAAPAQEAPAPTTVTHAQAGQTTIFFFFGMTLLLGVPLGVLMHRRGVMEYPTRRRPKDIRDHLRRQQVVPKTLDRGRGPNARRSEVREEPEQVRRADLELTRSLTGFRNALNTLGTISQRVLPPTMDPVYYQMTRDGILPVIKRNSAVLEMGVGSGIILSLLAEAVRQNRIQKVRFMGSDIDPNAVVVARKMMEKLNLQNVGIFQGNLFSAFDPNKKFDVIFWNPPWFSSKRDAERYGVTIMDKDYATLLRFLEEARDRLNPGGRIFLLFPVDYFRQGVAPKIADHSYQFQLLDHYQSSPKRGLDIGLFVYDSNISKGPGANGSQRGAGDHAQKVISQEKVLPVKMMTEEQLKSFLRRFRTRLNATLPKLGIAAQDILYPNMGPGYEMAVRGIMPAIKNGSDVLEMGVGSGVVLSLLGETVRRNRLHNVNFTGSDIELSAVTVATAMTQAFKLRDAEILQGDLFEAIEAGRQFDVIFWNPPWFSQGQEGKVSAAKMIDEDYGTIQRFLAQAPQYLKPGGRIFLLFPVDLFQKGVLPKINDPALQFDLVEQYLNNEKQAIGLFQYSSPIVRSEVREEAAVNGGDVLGAQNLGMGVLKEQLRVPVKDFGRIFFSLGDVDKIGAMNLVFGKYIVGVVGEAQSRDLLFPPRESPFFEFRKELQSILKKYHAGIYRGAGGDEFMIIAKEGFDPEALESAVRELTQAFRDRYLVVRINKPLEAEEVDFLQADPRVKDYVLAGMNFGRGVNLLVDKRKLDQHSETVFGLLSDLKWRFNLEDDQLGVADFEKFARGFFSVSVGGASAEDALNYLTAMMGQEMGKDAGRAYWTELRDVTGENGIIRKEEFLREDRLELFVTWGMRLANDALTTAKETGRNRVVIMPSSVIHVKKAMTAKKIIAEMEQIEARTGKSREYSREEIVDGKDRITGLLDESEGRAIIAAAYQGMGDAKPIAIIEELTVANYGGDVSGKQSKGRAFHLLQGLLGDYIKGDAVIKSLGQLARSIFRIEANEPLKQTLRKGKIPFREAPDKIWCAFTEGAQKTRGPPATVGELDRAALELGRTVQGLGATDAIPPMLVLTRISEEQLKLLNGGRQPSFASLLTTQDVMSLLEFGWFRDAIKSVEVTKKADLEKIVDVEWGEYSVILTFNYKKAGALLERYREAQERTGLNALGKELNGRYVTLAELEARDARSEVRAGSGEIKNKAGESFDVVFERTKINGVFTVEDPRAWRIQDETPELQTYAKDLSRMSLGQLGDEIRHLLFSPSEESPAIAVNDLSLLKLQGEEFLRGFVDHLSEGELTHYIGYARPAASGMFAQMLGAGSNKTIIDQFAVALHELALRWSRPEWVVTEYPGVGQVLDATQLKLGSAERTTMAKELYELEAKSFPSRQRKRTVAQWEAILAGTAGASQRVYMLRNFSGNIVEAVSGYFVPEAQMAELEELMSLDDSTRGKGTLLMDIFLSQAYRNGVKEIKWIDAGNDPGFFDRFLSPRVDAKILEFTKSGYAYRVRVLKDPLAPKINDLRAFWGTSRSEMRFYDIPEKAIVKKDDVLGRVVDAKRMDSAQLKQLARAIALIELEAFDSPMRNPRFEESVLTWEKRLNDPVQLIYLLVDPFGKLTGALRAYSEKGVMRLLRLMSLKGENRGGGTFLLDTFFSEMFKRQVKRVEWDYTKTSKGFYADDETGYLKPRLEQGIMKLLKPVGPVDDESRADVEIELLADPFDLKFSDLRRFWGSRRSEIRLDIPDEAVIAKDDRLGQVIDTKQLDPRQGQLLAEKISVLEPEYFSWKGEKENVRIWEANLAKPDLSTLALLTPSGDVAGVVGGYISSEDGSAATEYLMSRDDGVQGKGTFLLDAFLHILKERGVAELRWHFSLLAEKFYRNFLDARVKAGILRVVTSAPRSYVIQILQDPLDPKFNDLRTFLGIRRSEIRLDIPEKSVVATYPGLGQVVDVKELTLTQEQLKKIAQTLFEMAKARYYRGQEGRTGMTQDSVAKWEERLLDLERQVYLLISEGQVQGAIVGYPSSEEDNALIELIMTQKGEVRGSGTFLLDAYLSTLFRKGSGRVEWAFTPESRSFYDGENENYFKPRESFGLIRVDRRERSYEVEVLADPLDKKFSKLRTFWGKQRSEIRASMEQRMLGGIVEVDPTVMLSIAPEKVQAELEAKGHAAVGEAGKKIDERIAEIQKGLAASSNARGLSAVIFSAEFREQLKALLGEFGDTGELVSRIRGDLLSGEDRVSLKKAVAKLSRLDIARVREATDAIYEKIRSLPGSGVPMIVNNGRDAQFVLNALRKVEIPRLIVLYDDHHRIGRGWDGISPIVQTRKFSVHEPANVIVGDILKKSDGDAFMAFMTADLGIDQRGMLSVLADLSHEAIPELKELTCAAAVLINRIYASVSTMDQDLMKVQPGILLEELKKNGIDLLALSAKNGVIVMNMEILAQEFSARQSVEQAA